MTTWLSPQSPDSCRKVSIFMIKFLQCNHNFWLHKICVQHFQSGMITFLIVQSILYCMFDGRWKHRYSACALYISFIRQVSRVYAYLWKQENFSVRGQSCGTSLIYFFPNRLNLSFLLYFFGIPKGNVIDIAAALSLVVHQWHYIYLLQDHGLQFSQPCSDQRWW